VSQEPPPITFDPRQQKIHEQLVRLGPAPAAFFRDACRLFQNLAQLEASGNLAGHLLRELKSSIKNVLYPRDVKEKSDQDAVDAIADAYGLPKDHPVTQTWPNLRLDRLAHHGVLASPRQLADVREAWDELQTILGVLLDALDSGYTRIYERLDRLLAKPVPGKDDLAELMGKIPNNPHTWGYFFGRVQGRRWFELLAGSNVFDDSPRDAYWPQAEYLRRMAPEYPEEVARILEPVAATWSYYTQHTLLQALPSLPHASTGRILKASARALMSADRQDIYLAADIAKRAAEIAGDQPDAALDVIATLLALSPKSEDPQGGYFGARELTSPLDYHLYDTVLREPLQALITATPMPTFDRLLALLLGALAAVFTHTKPDDTSKGWLPAMEPHEQNTHHYEPLTRLAEAVRDAAETIVQGEPMLLPAMLEKIEVQGWQVLQRLSLHLCTRFGEPAEPLIQQRVLDPDMFFEYDYRHEYGALLKKVFPALSATDQATILDWIKSGPRTMPDIITAENAEYLRQSWRWLRLGWIREHLDAGDAAMLAELEKTHGIADESNEFSAYISGPFWGPTSPKAEDELREMPTPELVKYLREWQPTGERGRRGGFAPTREGLGRQLQQVVKARAAEFADAAELFEGLDATFVRSVIEGIENAVKANVAVPWAPVLRLCQWAVAQPRAIPGRDRKGFDNDPDWSWTWAAIARLLRTAFDAKGPATLPVSLRETVWSVLAPITDDPDPDAVRETDARDPMETAINSPRGVAMQAVVLYMIWAREREWAPPEGVTGFSDMPEVAQMLTRHLDPAIDPSRAIRAVYGEWLFYLYKMGGPWVEQHMADLFPVDHPDLADAVLHAYLGWGRYMTPDFNRLLRPQFARAVDSLPQAAAEGAESTSASVQHVAQRIIAMYLDGDVDLAPDSLMAKLFARLNEKARARSVFLVPTTIQNAEEGKRPAMQERARTLWAWRLDAAHDTELRGFGGWIEHEDFDPAWRLAQLQAVLECIGTVDMDYRIVETLGKLAAQFPAETFRCVRLLVGTNMDAMHVHRFMYRGDLQRIVHAARSSGDAALEREATSFANALVARGFQQFREVLANNYEPPPMKED
jgi:hypothetical protein